MAEILVDGKVSTTNLRLINLSSKNVAIIQTTSMFNPQTDTISLSFHIVNAAQMRFLSLIVAMVFTKLLFEW